MTWGRNLFFARFFLNVALEAKTLHCCAHVLLGANLRGEYTPMEAEILRFRMGSPARCMRANVREWSIWESTGSQMNASVLRV